MRKLLFFSLAATCIATGAFAQKQGQAKLDSLLAALPHQKEDSNKVKLLSAISFAYYSVNTREGIKYGNEQLALAKKLNITKGIVSAYNVLGINFMEQADYPSALENYFAGLKLAEQYNLKRYYSEFYEDIAITYNDLPQPDYIKALDYYAKALKLYEEEGDKQDIAATFANMGTVYAAQRKDSLAFSYYFKALKITEELNSKRSQSYELTSIANLYGTQGNCVNALEYGLKALKIAQQLNDPYAIGKSYASVSSTYMDVIRDSTGVQLKSLSINRTTALQEAKRYTDSSIMYLKKSGSSYDLNYMYEILSDIDEKMGDTRASLENYKKYTAGKDSSFNAQKDKKLTQIAMQYEFDKKEAASKADQEKKDIQQRLIRNSILAGLAGALVFLIVVYRQRNRISKEKKRSDELLLNILPAETAEELKRTGTTKAKDFEQVTVLFTDFKNFTLMSEQLSAQELVNEINYCYSEFDRIVTHHGLEKIKTIGDSYMCAGGLPVANKTNATDTVAAAMDIRGFMEREKQQREALGKPFFGIRIGCNTGPVVAGIVGLKKFAYDIWGDTVNIASRMESSGETGKVNISGSTFELVKDKFECIHRGKIEAKNKGMIDMYFVESGQI